MNDFGGRLRDAFRPRPAWMNVLMLFSAYMAVAYVPWDFLFKPVAVDDEVWFGFRLHGWAAKATEPLHLAIYAAGAWGFWRMRSWMWPWAAVYAAQVAIAMIVWAYLYAYPERGAPALAVGAAGFVFFGVLTVALWRARDRFQRSA